MWVLLTLFSEKVMDGVVAERCRSRLIVTHVSCCVVDKYVMGKMVVRILTVTRGKLSWLRSCSVMRVLEYRKHTDWNTQRVN